MCPGCAHSTSAAVGGICTVFVPGRTDGGPLAEYCGCDCYRATIGRGLMDEFADAMNRDRGADA
jgi:hypothetical protein